MSTWKIQGSRVYGNGNSYNCTNKVTAESLLNTLNTYEKTVELNKSIEKQYNNITKQIKQIQMSIKILEHEINTLQGLVKQ